MKKIAQGACENVERVLITTLSGRPTLARLFRKA
jgi:hypothetical protein